MSRSWIREKLPEFVRDLFRMFCHSSVALNREFESFDEEGVVCFECLRDLVGTEMDKGLLWRMKDTAHHVFRNDPEKPAEGQFLDWALGYIFHETVKLREDAYQLQNYGPWLQEIMEEDAHGPQQEVSGRLVEVLTQTRESMRREIDRIRFFMNNCRTLLPVYLVRHRDNTLLARFIFSHEDLVRSAFGSDYGMLMEGVYKDEPERMYVLACRSLRMGGWFAEANRAIEAALQERPDGKLVLQEKKIIDNWASRIKS
jgi:hypothetical protein